MVGKNVKIFIYFFLGLVIIGVFVSINRNRNADHEFNSLEFFGVINAKTYLINKKALFILVDTTWFGIMDIRVEKYFENGDSIFKKNDSMCINVKRKGSNTLEFCESYAYRVSDNLVIRNLNSILEKGKEKPTRE